MKAIHADPKTVRKIFAEKYVIPDFQRPYSWEDDQCDKLWEDITNFYNEKHGNDDKYFLGNLVIHQQGNSFAVIDGQQRLTTLLLLIKAFHQKAGVVKALEECFKVKDPLTSELTDELRIDSRVIEKDKIHLLDIILSNGLNTDDKVRLKANYVSLGNKITEWWNSVYQDTDSLNNFILTLLDQVVLLPIHCGSEDDALVIFETINNRGMSLTDADIFKAKLHKASNSERDIFIKSWNALENHEWLFRIYMHVLRAKLKDTSKEPGLRSYFSKENRLKEWKPVIDSLSLIHEVNMNWQASDKVEILWSILSTYTNYYWNFPLHVYLHKYGAITENGFVLDGDAANDFEMLLETTFKYFFLKGVVHNSVNAVKDTAFKVCAAIEANGDFISEYKDNIGDDYQEFERKIKNKQYGRYLNGLVLISAYLNPGQDQPTLKKVIKNNYHIEHILPKKWNNYDKWTSETWSKDINSLGNLVPLEWSLNISAKNEFFNRKKEDYRKSQIQEAKDLSLINDWHPDDFMKRHNEVENRILEFFK
jgi:hypothetical protein